MAVEAGWVREPPIGSLLRRRTPRRVWGAVVLAVTAATVARLPQVRREVEVRLAAGEGGVGSTDLEQAELAVTMGTTTALVLALALQALVAAGAMALERRTSGAGRAVVRGTPLSLTFLVVGGVMLCAQVAALLHPVSAGSVAVLVPLALVVGLGSTALARTGARWGLAARASFAVCLALTLTFAL